MGAFSSLKGLKNVLPHRSKNEDRSETQQEPPTPVVHSPDDPPPKIVNDSIIEFCSIDAALQEGREVALLPVIVENAGSGPEACVAAALRIRKYLSSNHESRPYEQYNAIMLLRILVKNPGQPFTAVLDQKFIDTTRKLLKDNAFFNVQHIMRQSLDMWETENGTKDDPGLQPILMMWKELKAKELRKPSRNAPNFIPSPTFARAPIDYPAAGLQQMPPSRPDGSRPHTSSNRLPSQVELASRVEEAKNTAKVFLQMIQSAPPEQVEEDELMREFYSRCQSAQKSMMGYINCENPAPDNDTMQTLIEVNEQLSLSMSRYQRSKLQGKRTHGNSAASTPQPDHPANRASSNTYFANPLGQNAVSQQPPPPRPAFGSLLDSDLSRPATNTAQPGSENYPVMQPTAPMNATAPYRSSLGTPTPDAARPLTMPPAPDRAAPQLDSPVSPEHLRSPFSDDAEIESYTRSSVLANDSGNGIGTTNWQQQQQQQYAPPTHAPPPPAIATVNGGNTHHDEDDLYAVSPVREGLPKGAAHAA